MRLEEICADFGLENAFQKPFCLLEPSGENPTISRLVSEFKIGRPKLEISTIKKEDPEGLRLHHC